MPVATSPLLVGSSVTSTEYSNLISIKILVSSLSRSLFNGSIHIFRNYETPLFKAERRQINEVFLSTSQMEMPRMKIGIESREFLLGHCKYLNPEPRQWVIIPDAAGLALRNIDHLIPADSNVADASAVADFYWTKIEKRNEDRGEVPASVGMWAVRGEHLSMVLERWQSVRRDLPAGESIDEAAVWSQLVRDLPLRKKSFEKGEVYAPRIGAVDWEAVSNAAFVTVPDWPEKEQWKFLQALYFGTYFGDETGLMLNILDP
jgi:hypothetical protein